MLHKRDIQYNGIRALSQHRQKNHGVLTGGNNTSEVPGGGKIIDGIISSIDTMKDNIINIVAPNNVNIEGSVNVPDDTVPDQPPELHVKINNDIKDLKTHAPLWINGIMPDYIKKNIMKVIKYYDNHVNPNKIHETSEHRRSIALYLHEVLKTVNDYDVLLKRFNAETSEELFAYMLLAYHDLSSDLMLRTTYTYGRILPFEHSSDWYDNFRLNAYGNAWNMFMYNKYNSASTVVIETKEGCKEIQPINKNINIDFERCVRLLIGSLRTFLLGAGALSNSSGGFLASSSLSNISTSKSSSRSSISNSLSNNSSTSSNDTQLTGAASDLSLKSLAGGKSFEEICDECYKQYIFYYGGCHGCDVFDNPAMSLSVEEIKNFVDKYPSAKVGYILNTATYASGRGQHWVAVMFTHDDVKLVCSQGSTWECFQDNSKLAGTIERLWGKNNMYYNSETIQTDGYNCGLYSAITLYSLLRTNDIKQTIKEIGVDMQHFGVEVGKPSTAAIIREKIAGTVPA